MAKMTKANEALLAQFGFVVEEAPERDLRRKSKYDEMWEAAATLLESMPGETLRVRTYTNASAAYADAKAINNGEHKHFTNGDEWLAVATKSDEVNDEGEPVYALWLTYKGAE